MHWTANKTTTEMMLVEGECAPISPPGVVRCWRVVVVVVVVSACVSNAVVW